MRSSLLVAVLSLIVACSSEDPSPQPSGSSSGTGGQGGASGGQSGSTQTGGGQSGAEQAGLGGSSGTSGQNNGGGQGGLSGASGQVGAGQGGTNQGGAGEAGTAGQGDSGASGAQAGASGQGTGGAEQGGAGQGGSSGTSGQSNGGSGPTGGTGGGNGGLAELVSAADFEAMFPNRSDPACNGGLFAYEALLEAAKAFPGFASEGSIDDRKRELAAFLANAGHETTGGWSTAPGGPQAWGLCFREEVGCDSGACTGYCVADAKYPCAPGKTYHGRGPLQLSYNYNYGQAGDALGLPLLATPELVASDGAVAFKTALWFWMTAQAPKPSCHAVMTGQWSPSSADAAAGRQPGFGMTVNIINGGIECNKPTPPQMEDRLAYYDRFTKLLGVAPGDHLTCDAMQSY